MDQSTSNYSCPLHSHFRMFDTSLNSHVTVGFAGQHDALSTTRCHLEEHMQMFRRNFSTAIMSWVRDFIKGFISTHTATRFWSSIKQFTCHTNNFCLHLTHIRKDISMEWIGPCKLSIHLCMRKNEWVLTNIIFNMKTSRFFLPSP